MLVQVTRVINNRPVYVNIVQIITIETNYMSNKGSAITTTELDKDGKSVVLYVHEDPNTIYARAQEERT